MAVTVANVRALAPGGDFDDVGDCVIQDVLDDVQLTIEDTSWCEGHADLATKNLAAHVLSLRLGGAQGVAGPVTAEAAGDISRSFGGGYTATNSTDGYYQQTVWGQEYLRLLRIQPSTPLAACSKGAVLYTG